MSEANQRSSQAQSNMGRLTHRAAIRGHHRRNQLMVRHRAASLIGPQSEVITGAINHGSSSGRLTHRAAVPRPHRQHVRSRGRACPDTGLDG
jgi:hypothetical protein